MTEREQDYTEELNKRTHIRWIRERATDAEIEDLRQHRNEMRMEIGELHRELEGERDHSFRARAAMAREKENVRSVGRTAQELRDEMESLRRENERKVEALEHIGTIVDNASARHDHSAFPDIERVLRGALAADDHRGETV